MASDARRDDAADAGPEGPGRRRGARPWLLLAVAVVVLVAGGAFVAVAVRHRQQQGSLTSLRASGLPDNVPTPLANLMTLASVPHRKAPGFDLVNQNGRELSLSSLRGRVVVLTFMDPHCRTICPIVSQEFVDAYHDLGRTARHVAFVAVNVNPYFKTPADVAAFSREHGLDAIPSWRYVTGSMQALKQTWRHYTITVEASGPTADVVHTSFVYFIGPNGTERYLASPTDDHTTSGTAYLPANQLTSWGRGIALVARDLIG